MRRSRRWLALAAVLTAGTTLAMGVGAGLTYVWCAPMREARLACCCPVERSEAPAARGRCCEPREVADAPEGAADQSPPVASPASLATLAAPVCPTDPGVESPPAHPVVRARGSPGLRVHSICSVYLL